MRSGCLVVAVSVLSACGRVGIDPLDAIASDAPTDSTLVQGCVTWDPDIKGSNVMLKQRDFHATSRGGGMAVATHALTGTTGQRAYLEIFVLRADNNAEIGIKDDTFSHLDDYHFKHPGSNLHYDNYYSELNGIGSWSILINPSQPDFRTGDVVMWALDRAAGVLWYGRNGSWFGLGDPAMATNPTGAALSTDSWIPSVYAIDDAEFQLRTSRDDFDFAPPAGFPSFSEAVGFEDAPCVTPGTG